MKYIVIAAIILPLSILPVVVSDENASPSLRVFCAVLEFIIILKISIKLLV